MSAANVDADVFRELDRLADGAGEARVPVVVEHAVPAHTLPGEPPTDLADVTARLSRLRQDLLDHLRRLGVADAHELALANAVVAALTREQVEAVASRPDVRRVFLSRPEQVTI